jgi:hypothetical protein
VSVVNEAAAISRAVRAFSNVKLFDQRKPRRKRRKRLSDSVRREIAHRTRRSELHKVFGRMYGGGYYYVFSDDDAGREHLHILLDHYRHKGLEWLGRIIACRAPWMPDDERDALLDEVDRHPRFWRAQALAKALNLTLAVRDDLKLRTVGAVDASRAKRKRLSKQRKSQKWHAKQRAAGKRTRAQYLADVKKDPKKRSIAKQAAAPDPWQAAIATFIAAQDSVSVAEVLQGLGVSRSDQTAMSRAARCLTAIGWTKYRARDGQQRTWKYRLGPTRSYLGDGGIRHISEASLTKNPRLYRSQRSHRTAELAALSPSPGRIWSAVHHR